MPAYFFFFVKLDVSDVLVCFSVQCPAMCPSHNVSVNVFVNKINIFFQTVRWTGLNINLFFFFLPAPYSLMQNFKEMYPMLYVFMERALASLVYNASNLISHTKAVITVDTCYETAGNLISI